MKRGTSSQHGVIEEIFQLSPQSFPPGSSWAPSQIQASSPASLFLFAAGMSSVIISFHSYLHFCLYSSTLRSPNPLYRARKFKSKCFHISWFKTMLHHVLQSDLDSLSIHSFFFCRTFIYSTNIQSCSVPVTYSLLTSFSSRSNDSPNLTLSLEGLEVSHGKG